MRSSRGFTLTELLVACAVLSILAGVTFPTVKYTRKRMKEIELHAQLREMEGDQRVQRSYQSGLQALQRGEQEKAYAAFTETLKLNPHHIQAAQKAEEVKQDLIQRYHKSAMAAFHRQDLDSAIKEWDKVLVLDPGNESARLNRARAVELRKRIQKFGK